MLSHFSLLDNTFHLLCLNLSRFILGQCLNVQHFEHVIWLQKVFVLWRKRLLSGWLVLELLLANSCNEGFDKPITSFRTACRISWQRDKSSVSHIGMLSVLNISDNQLILIIGAYSVFSIPLFTPLHVDAAVPVGLRAGGRLRAQSWEVVVSHLIHFSGEGWKIVRHFGCTFEVPNTIVKENPLPYIKQQLNARNTTRWKVQNQTCVTLVGFLC